MKKFAAALAAVLLLCVSLTAPAAAASTMQALGEQSIAVYGRAESRKNYYEIVLGTADGASVTLPDGTAISGTSTAAADDGLQVIIIPVTAGEEAAAYAWLSMAARGLGGKPAAYYLAFYRDDLPAQPEGLVTVSMTGKEGAKLYYMDGSGASQRLSFTTEARQLRFSMERSGYYLTVRAKSPSPAVPVAPVSPSQPVSPKTGDAFPAEAYLPVMAVSALALALLPTARRRTAA